jgi:SAM-dependent methyltransferase
LRTKLLSLKRPDDHNLLELGCGSGRVLATLTNDFSQTTGIEGHISALKSAVASCPNSRLLHANVLKAPLTDEQFDWVVAFDVLEHVDPSTFLNEAFRLTRPGGRLLLSVPAFPMLWSHVDNLAGHRCRYRLKQLTEELNAAGWRSRGHTYFQFLLFPLLAISRLLNRNKQSQFERKPPHVINWLLRMINHLEVSLFQRLTLPFGSSLIIWADKPHKTAADYD